MLMNNLDPEVAERPRRAGRLRRHRPRRARLGGFDRIVATLRRLEDDETLLVQSGKPVGVFRTHADAPRVLIANSNLVPRWATWDHFNELDRKGLMMYGQMTAGSWIYIGSQGIVQGTYETFVEMGRRHYGGDLSGRWILTAGLGGMGGAQPLAATMAGASMLAVECQPSRIEMRLRTGYLDVAAKSLDEALEIIARATCIGQSRLGRPAGQRRRDPARAGPPRRAAGHGHRPDLGPRSGQRLPAEGLDAAAMGGAAASAIPKGVERAAKQSMAEHVRAMLALFHAGVPTVDYGNNIRQMALDEGVADAFDFPGFVPAYIRPLFCRGIGPFRWAALSGDPEDIYQDRRQGEGADPRQPASAQLARHGAGAHPIPGPAGAHLLGGAGRPPSPRPRLQRDGGARRAEGADRHRPRSPRFRLGRLAQPRDRGDAGRLRRGVRLAAAERAAQLRLGRDLGVDPSRRRRRHGLFAARRHGDRVRRHARTRRAASPACCGTIPPPASCATPTPATKTRSPARGKRGWICRVCKHGRRPRPAAPAARSYNVADLALRTHSCRDRSAKTAALAAPRFRGTPAAAGRRRGCGRSR